MPVENIDFSPLKRFLDISGNRYGRLVAVRPLGKARGGCVVWECVCDCGVTTNTNIKYLTAGRTVSCGCKKREQMAALGPNSLTHGATVGRKPSELYNIWSLMIARCERVSSPAYANYGGRGIKVCDRWRNSFEAFRDDVGERPSAKHSIDRIDVNGNYEPSNVRWATPKEQAQNTRRHCPSCRAMFKAGQPHAMSEHELYAEAARVQKEMKKMTARYDAVRAEIADRISAVSSVTMPAS